MLSKVILKIWRGILNLSAVVGCLQMQWSVQFTANDAVFSLSSHYLTKEKCICPQDVLSCVRETRQEQFRGDCRQALCGPSPSQTDCNDEVQLFNVLVLSQSWT